MQRHFFKTAFLCLRFCSLRCFIFKSVIASVFQKVISSGGYFFIGIKYFGYTFPADNYRIFYVLVLKCSGFPLVCLIKPCWYTLLILLIEP